jgi:outer membrane immunogenic protein
MQLKLVVSLVGLAFFFGAAAQAQERQVIDVGVTYSYVRYNPATSGIRSFSMNGGSGSVAVNFKSWLSGVVDVGGYSKHNVTGNGVDGSLSTYLFGPRVSLNRYGRFAPFGQVLVGIAHTGGRYLTTGGSQTPFAAAIGGGLDWRWTNHIRVRAAEVDYLLAHFSEVNNGNTQVQNNVRVSSGLVFRF